MGVFAKSYSGVTALAKRWVSYRVNRNLDNRDFVLRDALKVIEQWALGVYPRIQAISATLASLAVAANTGLTISGVNFIGDASKSTGSTDAGVTNKAIAWTAIRPGAQDISLVITDTGALAVVSVVGSVITITIDGVANGSSTTATALVNAIAAHATAKFKLVGVANGTGLGVVTAQTVTVTGGTGTLPVLAIGALAVGDTAGFGITAYTDTQITFNFDASTYSLGMGKQLHLTVDDVHIDPIDIIVGGASVGAGDVTSLADPGTGVAIPVTASRYVGLVVGAGAETNTLAIPTFLGQKMILNVDTIGGGTRVVTVGQGINKAGNTIITFAALRDNVVLEAVKVAGAFRWQVTWIEGATPS
jgi:hypothetical protein